jgi:hypothetical protein
VFQEASDRDEEGDRGADPCLGVMETYDKIFAAWVEELRGAWKEAMEWWDGLQRSSPEPDPSAAYASVRLRWPAGPCSYPRVIAVFRKYYLATEELNQKREADRQNRPRVEAGWGEDDEEQETTVHPLALLMDGLGSVDTELEGFMSGFVFFPTGTDEEGRVA